MTRKNTYQALILAYKKRREAAKVEMRKNYQKRISRYSYKIKLWSREIRRIEQREKKLDAICNRVKSYSDIYVKNSHPKKGKELTRVRTWFFKYCLETGFRSVDLAEYTGCKLSRTPARSRRKLNKIITSDPKERDLWLRFKHFMDSGE